MDIFYNHFGEYLGKSHPNIQGGSNEQSDINPTLVLNFYLPKWARVNQHLHCYMFKFWKVPMKGQIEPTPTSTSWWMDGVWIGNNFHFVLVPYPTTMVGNVLRTSPTAIVKCLKLECLVEVY
jgi:hypothetical protein